MRALVLSICLIMSAATPLLAAGPSRPIVVELFTSQGCNSCPPADALLTEISRDRPDVLALAFHVTYWDSLGWKDPFAFAAATARQREYARISGAGGVYTPQAVIDGTQDVIGSDRNGMQRALRSAAAAVTSVPLLAVRDGDGLAIAVPAGTGNARVLLIGYDPQHSTKVGRGENAGETLVESNIVRSLENLGDWNGQKLDLRARIPAGERLAVILQAADGHILGAARVDRNGA